MRCTVRAAIAALAAALITVSQATAAPATGAPLEIDVVISQTGGGAFLAAKTIQTLDILQKMVNAQGGIDGRPVRFVYADDGTNPQTAVQLIAGLAGKSRAVIGSSVVATCAAMIPVVSSGPVSYCLAPPVQPPAGSYMFVGGTNAAEFVATTLRYFRSRRLTRIGLMAATDASGQAFERDFDAYMAGAGGKTFTVVDRERFNTTDLSMDAQVAKMKQSAPQAILTFTIGPSFGTLLKNLYDSGVNVPTSGSAGNLSYAQLDAYKAFAPTELLFVGNAGAVQDPSARGSVKLAQERYFKALQSAGLRPEYLYSMAWDPALLYISALHRIGPDATPSQIRAYVVGVRDWSGVYGTYDFVKYPQRGLGPDALVLYQWDAAKSALSVLPLPRL